MRTGVRAESVRHDGTAFTVTLDSGEEFVAAHLLVATGRRIDLAGLDAARTHRSGHRSRVRVGGRADIRAISGTSGDAGGSR